LIPLIRPAAEPDLRAVALLIDRAVRISNAPEYSIHERLAVLADYTLPALKRRLDKAEIFLVAELPGVDKGPLGVVSAAQGGHPFHERTLIIDTMFVDPSMQGMGLGGALLDDAAARAKRLDYTVMTVAASLTATPFYAHMGFSRVAAGRSGRGVDTVMMERTLR
jgi:GNAT superfamily N-acetyltransferase